MSVPNIPNWQSLSSGQRARAVLDWCIDSGIHVGSIMDYQLDAAMKEAAAQIAEETGVSHESSPMDYVHLVRVLAAFLRSRI